MAEKVTKMDIQFTWQSWFDILVKYVNHRFNSLFSSSGTFQSEYLKATKFIKTSVDVIYVVFVLSQE